MQTIHAGCYGTRCLVGGCFTKVLCMSGRCVSGKMLPCQTASGVTQLWVCQELLEMGISTRQHDRCKPVMQALQVVCMQLLLFSLPSRVY